MERVALSLLDLTLGSFPKEGLPSEGRLVFRTAVAMDFYTFGKAFSSERLSQASKSTGTAWPSPKVRMGFPA